MIAHASQWQARKGQTKSLYDAGDIRFPDFVHFSCSCTLSRRASPSKNLYTTGNPSRLFSSLRSHGFWKNIENLCVESCKSARTMLHARTPIFSGAAQYKTILRRLEFDQSSWCASADCEHIMISMMLQQGDYFSFRCDGRHNMTIYSSQCALSRCNKYLSTVVDSDMCCPARALRVLPRLPSEFLWLHYLFPELRWI
jgi:hypothetical protein